MFPCDLSFKKFDCNYEIFSFQVVEQYTHNRNIQAVAKVTIDWNRMFVHHSYIVISPGCDRTSALRNCYMCNFYGVSYLKIVLFQI